MNPEKTVCPSGDFAKLGMIVRISKKGLTDKTLDEYRNLYYPDDEVWRGQVLKKSRKVFAEVLLQVGNLS